MSGLRGEVHPRVEAQSGRLSRKEALKRWLAARPEDFPRPRPVFDRSRGQPFSYQSAPRLALLLGAGLHGEPLVEDPGRITTTRALGIDEHKVLSAGKDHHTFYATSFVDVTTGQLLDVVRDRSATDVRGSLSQGGNAIVMRIEVSP